MIALVKVSFVTMDSSNGEKRDIMLSYSFFFLFLVSLMILPIQILLLQLNYKVVRYAGNADVRLLWVYLHYLMQMKLIVPW